MNEEQITELVKQITRIADVLELIQDCDIGSLAGIEMALWKLDNSVRGKEEESE
jgi:Asp-tRNA(Asn)/Glu-tRNA(Gln) amidotransferase C subunit